MQVMGLLSGDEALAVFAPLVVYWVYSGMYELAAGRFSLDKRYGLFPREDEDGKNLITRWAAVKGVLFNQAFQIASSFLFFFFFSGGGAAVVVVQPPLYAQAVQLLVAILVLDVWQYFGHRLLHTNKMLYRHIHALHHHLVVPYAFGAQYQHPLEALLLDNLGLAIATQTAGMTPRTATFFFCLTIVKVVDDHCGLWLPGHPFHLVFSNNSAFHAIHHQLYGGKANFSAPYFTIWDKIMGTYMPYAVEEKDGGGGGYELKPLKAPTAVKED